ncbi:MAG: GAF domain-containing protein [Anaerolineae bacterium]|nr:GAF domain-containing protein [Anaerolineae bacterium]NUQ06081.1 GAF domain-containing protein [Anaerolineae bacterium]
MTDSPPIELVKQALETTTNETRQLEALTERLTQVLTQNGFQISVDIPGVIRRMTDRLEDTGKELKRVGTQMENLEELLRTFSLITGSLELDEVLEDVMDTVIRITGAERAYLLLQDKKTNALEISVARNWDQKNINDDEAVFSRSVVNQTMESKQAIITSNAQSDSVLQNAKSVMAHNLRSILCVPLALSGQPIGVLYADNRITNDVFRHEAIPLLTAFGTQAAIAIDNAQRYAQVKRDLEEARLAIQALQIEIDRRRVDEEVSQVTESDFFQRLTAQAREMRDRSQKRSE